MSEEVTRWTFVKLESVCAVVKYGNYSEAAYNIASSPSVISKHVAKVERELGIKIFDRGASKSRTGTLTKEGGQQIIGYLTLIVELWHNAHKKASELLMSETEKLAVGYISFIGNYRENEILARFSPRIHRCSYTGAPATPRNS